MKRIVVITSKFNIMTGDENKVYSVNEKARLDKEWIDYRLDIFMKYTAQCLINQTDQRFIALYAYEDSTEKILKDALRKYPKLPDNIKFIKKSDYMKTLDKVVEGFDILMLSRLDSDDLYHNEFVERLMNYKFREDTEEILCQNGYIYDSVNNRLAEYYHEQFTFYTFIYRLGKGENKYSYLNIHPLDLLLNFSHFSTLNYKYELLNGRNFIFVIHKDNTNSTFSDYNMGYCRIEKIIEKQQFIEDILYDFL